MKITKEDLREDLLKKTNRGGYFNDKLFEDDDRTYARRSFGDLFKYYEPMGVTEELLLEVLLEIGMGGRICFAAKKLVFCRIDGFQPEEDSYKTIRRSESYAPYEDSFIKDKYNITYMDALYKRIPERVV